jgi:VIT1/CCC1 family predicted Fe2+/Mn2+ transporter
LVLSSGYITRVCALAPPHTNNIKITNNCFIFSYCFCITSFGTFAAGAAIPLLPYILGFASLPLSLAVGGLGLLLAGGLSARFTRKSYFKSATRQLLFGSIAVAATYLVGMLLGVREF